MKPAASIVIPIYNEEVNIGDLLERIAVILPQLPSPCEVIVVDDGSRDATLKRLLDAKGKYPWLKVVELRRNFGQHAATYAGFDNAQGDIIVTLDGDLQNDPADIPKLIDKLREGYDVVCGWRPHRQDPFFSRRLPSLVVNRIIRSDAPTPVHDYGCFLRAYTQRAARELSERSTSRGWFPVLFAKLGFRVAEVPVSHHERPGRQQSKHDFFTRFDQFMSVFMGVRTRPFQFVQVIGAVGMVFGGVGFVVALVCGATGTGTEIGLWLLASAGLGLWGFLIVVTGTVGEYLVGMNYEIGRHPKYLIRKVHD
ncbi:MAG TPA: glycosyltransferase family 2 protein [Verrucomicrobiae bacterium]|nr:glycosyltransferase family 2 protein [Verrucomicrobiae bacterium]